MQKTTKKIQLDVKVTELKEEELQKVAGGADASWVITSSGFGPIGPRRLPETTFSTYYYLGY